MFRLPTLRPETVERLRRSFEEFKEFFMRPARRIAQHVSELTAFELLGIVTYITLIVFGSGLQLLALNFWLTKFTTGGGPFTVLTLSASFAAIVFVIALGVYMLLALGGRLPMPKLRWILQPKSLALITALGATNSMNGVLLVNATGPTPEIWQAMLLSTQMIWTFLFTRVIFGDMKSILNKYLIVAIVGIAVCAGGIVLGMVPAFVSMTMLFDTKMWTLIFAVSMIPGALYNVFASAFMRTYSRKDTDECLYNTESKTFVKMVMLALGGVMQVVFMFVFFPLDFAPWFGANAGNPAASWESLKEGWICVFTCADNYKYFLLFNLGYVCQYLGSAYLNFHSATLTAMMGQLASPITAIVLAVAPAWNIGAEIISVGDSIGAAVLIAVGTVIYFMWEEVHSENLEQTKTLPTEQTTLLQSV